MPLLCALKRLDLRLERQVLARWGINRTIVLIFTFTLALAITGAANHLKFRSEVKNFIHLRAVVTQIQDISLQATRVRTAALRYMVQPSPEKFIALRLSREALRKQLRQAVDTATDKQISQDLRTLHALYTIPDDAMPNLGASDQGDQFLAFLEVQRLKHRNSLTASELHIFRLQYFSETLVVISFIAVLLLSISYAFSARRHERETLHTRFLEKIAEEKNRTDLLARELSHRVKNLFAVVMSIVSATARHETDAVIAAQKTRERINALAQAHSLAYRGSNEYDGVLSTVAELVDVVVRPYVPNRGGLTYSGDRVPLTKTDLTPLSLILNELATNALKYGCWSHELGHLQIAITGTDRIESLQWCEEGGPAPVASSTQAHGFGTEMLQASVTQMAGHITRDWDENGLHVSIEFPCMMDDANA